MSLRNFWPPVAKLSEDLRLRFLPARRFVLVKPRKIHIIGAMTTRMKRLLLRTALCLWIFLMGLTAAAQDALPLSLVDTRSSLQPDGFGGETPVVTGALFNRGAHAYRNVSIYVEAFDADGELIGEGFGFLVDACGTALLDYALPPMVSQAFSAPYDVFAAGEVARVALEIDAEAVPAESDSTPEIAGVHRITDAEVVMLEWLDDQSLIYGVGCDGNGFTELAWWRYNLADETATLTAHPDAHHVTPEMLALAEVTLVTQSGEQDPDLYFNSRLTFAPTARRIVYQNDLHSIFSAEPDGSYRRLIHRELHRHSLRGFVWARDPGVFLAYYFGAYGEPVRYFTADVDGQMQSGWLENLPPSVIVPGPAPDGFAAVVGRASDEPSGYYWQHAYGANELLFAAELPGNNYPAPVVTGTQIFITRDIDGVPDPAMLRPRDARPDDRERAPPAPDARLARVDVALAKRWQAGNRRERRRWRLVVAGCGGSVLGIRIRHRHTYTQRLGSAYDRPL